MVPAPLPDMFGLILKKLELLYTVTMFKSAMYGVYHLDLSVTA